MRLGVEDTAPNTSKITKGAEVRFPGAFLFELLYLFAVQTTSAARPADAKRATVADDVGATVRDRCQFCRAESGP